MHYFINEHGDLRTIKGVHRKSIKAPEGFTPIRRAKLLRKKEKLSPQGKQHLAVMEKERKKQDWSVKWIPNDFYLPCHLTNLSTNNPKLVSKNNPTGIHALGIMNKQTI